MNLSTHAYASLTPAQKAVWLTLEAGANTVDVTVVGNSTADAEVGFRYSDHYA